MLMMTMTTMTIMGGCSGGSLVMGWEKMNL